MPTISETTWAVVVVTLINMIGSVSNNWLRYYYRAHYGVSDGTYVNGRTVGNGQKKGDNL